MKSKRRSIPEKWKDQVEWAEKISNEEIIMMLLDGKSKTSCGCEVIGENVCPHDNMGALQLLMLQLSEEELEDMKEKMLS